MSAAGVDLAAKLVGTPDPDLIIDIRANSDEIGTYINTWQQAMGFPLHPPNGNFWNPSVDHVAKTYGAVATRLGKNIETYFGKKPRNPGPQFAWFYSPEGPSTKYGPDPYDPYTSVADVPHDQEVQVPLKSFFWLLHYELTKDEGRAPSNPRPQASGGGNGRPKMIPWPHG